ncbi:MAG TPA: hypothetical protein VML19_20435 [Verrucomicrobiae bacterium]|nr:hypothetical protein [Verrucomicrobiae bacterium]
MAFESVGMRGRVQNVRNKAEDQQTIIQLLATIPNSSGGKADDWTTPPLAGPNGSCPRHLVDAIWSFQSFWKRRGEFAVVDGVVDPAKHTYRKLYALSKSTPPDGPRPSPAPSTPDAPLTPTRVTTSHALSGFRRTSWRFKGSAGLSGGLGPVGASAGYLDLTNDATQQNGRLLYSISGGGLGTAPGGFQISTPDMPSYGDDVILASPRISGDLQFSDMQGVGGVLGGTVMLPGPAAMPGGSVSFILLGCPTMLSASVLFPGFASGAIFPLFSLAGLCSAFGVMYGELKGTTDYSISLQTGLFL